MSSYQTMEDRAVDAMHQTWQAIGADLQQASGSDEPIDDETLRDVIPDGHHMEMYGGDKEAVEWFRSLGYDEQDVVLKRAFPH